MLCVLCKEYTFLRSRKSTAYYKDVLSCKELTVTGSTISHTMAFILCLTLKANHPRVCTCSKKYTKALNLTLGGLYLLYIIIHIYRCYLGKLELRSKVLCLYTHFLGKCLSICDFNAWIVYHLRSNGNLSTEFLLFKHYYPVAGSCKVKSRSKSCRTSANDSNII